MKSTFNVLFFLKRDKQKKDGRTPLMCRITVDGKEARFSMKQNVVSKQWDVKANKAIGRANDVVETNLLIDKTRSSLFQIYRDLQDRGKRITAEVIKNSFLGLDTSYETLLSLFDKHNQDARKLIGKGLVADTVEKYELTRRRLHEFMTFKYNISDINIKEVNNMFILDFETYMRTIGNCSGNTAAKYMRLFKKIILLAKNNGLLNVDPFASYKIQFKKVDRGYLTQHELEAIMAKEFTIERLEHVRDIFIFACFTGLAYIDVQQLRKEHIRESFDGKPWIMTKRQKTGVPTNVPLLEVPQAILKKYEDKLTGDKLLPVPSNQKLNSYLKEIADLCNVNKNLTFHMARHTFSTTITLSQGVPIESVSKMLGHTNIRTTQIYARITNEKVSNDMDILSEKLKGKGINQAVNQ